MNLFSVVVDGIQTAIGYLLLKSSIINIQYSIFTPTE